MGKPNRATQEKRNRERAQKERQQEKDVLRATRNNDARSERETALEQGIDPDLIGIFPGPQPVLEE